MSLAKTLKVPKQHTAIAMQLVPRRTSNATCTQSVSPRDICRASLTTPRITRTVAVQPKLQKALHALARNRQLTDSIVCKVCTAASTDDKCKTQLCELELGVGSAREAFPASCIRLVKAATTPSTNSNDATHHFYASGVLACHNQKGAVYVRQASVHIWNMTKHLPTSGTWTEFTLLKRALT